MSVSSLENFEHLMIYPLPIDDVELNSLAESQVKYFLRKKSRKRELFKVKREMCKETANQWLKKHSSPALLDDVSTEELRTFHRWFAATTDTFKSEEGVLQTRKLFQHLDSIGIFESKSQVVKFIHMLDFKKRDLRLCSFPEFSYALRGCGLQAVAKFRAHVSSQTKKAHHHRQTQKLPLHMNTNASSPTTNTSTFRKDSGSSRVIKRTTTKTLLVGGGVMYACCPDVSSFGSNLAARASTAPAASPTDSPPASQPMPVLHKKIGKLIRQKTSKFDLLGSSGGGLLPSVVQCGSPGAPSGPRKALLVLDSDASGRPERDDDRPPPAAAAAAGPVPRSREGREVATVSDKLKRLQAMSHKT